MKVTRQADGARKLGVCVGGGNKNKNQVTAALVGTQCLRDGKDTTPVLVKKCQTRH